MEKAKNAKVKVQKFGTFLSGMVMPNIGAFIAWGVLTALFIETGWLPNEDLNHLVAPTLKYLMPLLIGYTGGTMVHGRRGGVAGAIATMGVVIGADITMLIGGMVMGPLGAIVMKKVDKLLEGKVKPGLEMLIDNFSMGLVGAVMMVVGYLAIEPVFNAILTILSSGVQVLMDHNLLPFTSIFVQPAQMLFLNNAINHGIMVPVGVEQAAETGKSLLFLVEANGGVWTGVALAFAIWGKGMAKKSAPAAVAIMGLGGIAEVVFPYVLSKPKAIIGPILGNMAGLFTLQILGGGTVAAVSPGSIFALLAMTPKGGFAANLAGYAVALVVTTVVTGMAIGFGRGKDEEYADQTEAAVGIKESAAAISARKADKKDEMPVVQEAANLDIQEQHSTEDAVWPEKVKKIIFACDAGMGSSVMAVSLMKNKVNKAMLDVEVEHMAIQNLDESADIIVTSQALEARVKDTILGFSKKIPVFPMNNLLDNKKYDELIELIKLHI